MTELEEIQLKRSMGESIAILRKYTEIERFGVTEELDVYDKLVELWHHLFPEPTDYA